MKSSVERPTDREIIFTRIFDAPRELVWRVWSSVEHLQHWYGPTGFTSTTHEFNFAPGGVWRFVMHAPDGRDNPNRIVFREIDPPSRIVYENSWDYPGAPLDFSVVVTFTPERRKTKLSIHMTFRDLAAMKTAVEQYGVVDGGTQTLERIAHYLPTIR